MDCDLPQTNFKTINENEELDEILIQKKYKVLVKSLPKNSEPDYFKEFQRQIDLFRAASTSKHVAKLLALSFENDHYMILEYGEDLKSYMTTHPDNELLEKELVKFCMHVTKGLEFIAGLKATHR